MGYFMARNGKRLSYNRPNPHSDCRNAAINLTMMFCKNDSARNAFILTALIIIIIKTSPVAVETYLEIKF